MFLRSMLTIPSGDKWHKEYKYPFGADDFIKDWSTLFPSDTDYYINFTYRKDGSGNSNDDRFYIYGLKFERA